MLISILKSYIIDKYLLFKRIKENYEKYILLFHK